MNPQIPPQSSSSSGRNRKSGKFPHPLLDSLCQQPDGQRSSPGSEKSEEKREKKKKNKNPFALTRVHWTLPADPSAQPQLAVLAQTLPARCLIYGRAGIGGRDRCPGTGTPRQVHVNPVPAGPERGLQLGIAVSGFALRFGGRWGWVGVLLFLCV